MFNFGRCRILGMKMAADVIVSSVDKKAFTVIQLWWKFKTTDDSNQIKSTFMNTMWYRYCHDYNQYVMMQYIFVFDFEVERLKILFSPK